MPTRATRLHAVMLIAAVGQAIAGPGLPPVSRLAVTTAPVDVALRTGADAKADDGWIIIAATKGGMAVRLRFDHWHLPDGAMLVVTSTLTGESAELDANDLESWYGFTPAFNGSEVLVELVSLDVATVKIGSVIGLDVFDEPVDPDKDLCGPDDRIRDTTSAVARQWTGGLCTASLIATGEHFVSAGHCGPVPAGAFVEFDPPDSTDRGTRRLAPPERQFPINTPSVRIDNDWVTAPCPSDPSRDCIVSLGDDGMIYRVNRNVDGRLPGQVRPESLAIALREPGGGTPLRKWGCGVTIPETSTLNRTMKRADGSLDEFQTRDNGSYAIYDIDSTGGDSGGPLIDQTLGVAIAVNSFTSISSCNNSGAFAFSDPDFRALVEAGIGQPSARFVDASRPGTLPGGAATIWNPQPAFNRIDESTPAGGIIYVAPGTYSVGDGLLDRPVTITAPFGGVTLTP